MHLHPIGQVEIGREPPLYYNPMNLSRFYCPALSGARKTGSQTFFDERTERPAQLGSTFLSGNQQVVRQLDGGFQWPRLPCFLGHNTHLMR